MPASILPDGARARIFAAYGWAGGLIGDLSVVSRVEELADRAATVAADTTLPDAGKYSADLAAMIADTLAEANSARLLATGGERQVLIDDRDNTTELLRISNSRGRFLYCGASDDLDATPELAKIGMPPWRERGEAQAQPYPDAPGPVSYDAATHMLSLGAMPAHASFLHAYRQPAGAPPVLAGVSNTPTVSVVGITPLVAG